jgi:excisionase family DNA binding protein
VVEAVNASDSPLLTVSETARFLRVTEATVRRWCRDGDLPAVKAGRKNWLIDTTGTLSTGSTSMRGDHPVAGRVR